MTKSAGFFVTGTDTEVGKTLVSGALIVKLREQQLNVIGFKPVVAGTYKDKNGITLNEDLEKLRIASNLSHGDLSLCPYVLDQPAAPHLVAAQQGLKLEMSVMHNAFQDIHKHADCVVVEGAGGLLIPLNQDEDLGGFAKNTEEMPLLHENLQTLQVRIGAPFLGLIPTLPKELEKATDGPYSTEALHFAAKHIQLPNQ